MIIPVILFITAICLFPMAFNGWVNWDDPAYVTANRMVRDFDLKEIFTNMNVVGLYHPLTLLTLALDYKYWVTEAFGFHLTSLIIHLINTLLVYRLFRLMGVSLLITTIVSLLFGMHPMHVESVAWISGRKDVLYVLFFLLSLISYVRMSQAHSYKRRTIWYVISFLMFVCSLLSKNIAFVLPLILFLVDYHQRNAFTWRSFLLKIPFVLIATGAVFTAKYGQQSSDSMDALAAIDYSTSIMNGAYNYTFYVFKFLIPIKLSPFHPYPIEQNLTWIYISAMFFVIGMLVFALWAFIKKHKKIFFGIAFYTICIAPLLQIIPFGKALSSERYSYLAYIGLFYVFALLIKQVLKHSKKLLKGSVLIVIVLWGVWLGYSTNRQTKVWEDSEILWTHVIDLYPDSFFAKLSRGRYFMEIDRYKDALRDFNGSINAYPTADGYYERGYCLEMMGRKNQAIGDYLNAIELDSLNAKAQLNVGLIYAQYGEREEALEHLKQAIVIDSTYSLAYFNCATLFKIDGKLGKANQFYTKAVELEPNNPQYLTYRAVSYIESGNYVLALKDINRCKKLKPKQGDLYYLTAIIYLENGERDKAIQEVNKAFSLGYKVPNDFMSKLYGVED